MKKILLIEVLWEVILSDNEVHDFESNLLKDYGWIIICFRY